MTDTPAVCHRIGTHSGRVKMRMGLIGRDYEIREVESGAGADKSEAYLRLNHLEKRRPPPRRLCDLHGWCSNEVPCRSLPPKRTWGPQSHVPWPVEAANTVPLLPTCALRADVSFERGNQMDRVPQKRVLGSPHVKLSEKDREPGMPKAKPMTSPAEHCGGKTPLGS